MKNNNIDFYEIYDYYYQPLVQRVLFRWGMGIFLGIVLILLLLLLVWYLKKRKLEKSILPWEWAINSLNGLSLEKIKNKRDFKLFYFCLTSILKQYLCKRFDWDVEDKTDEELIKFLKNKNFDSVALKKLFDLFQEALWIKFANQDTLKIQAQKDLKIVEEIIYLTKPQDQSK